MTTTKMMTTSSGWDALLETETKKKRAKVNDIDVADGGYLTWLYGSATRRMSAWPPEFIRNALVMMDSKKSNRRDRSPHYKSGRVERRERSERANETYLLVKDFQRLIVEDPRITFLSVPGCEADDLVAIAAWKFGDPTEPLHVFGQDKDLLQIGPYFTMVEKEGEEVTLGHFHEGLPKALQNAGPLEAWHIPIVLALLGDRSDSVPRFLPRGPVGLRVLAEMLWGTDKPWQMFEEKFPEALPNLYDVLLPDPFLLGLGPGDTIPLLREKRWDAQLLKRLTPGLKKRTKEWHLLR